MLHVLLSKSLPLFYEERRATIKVTEAVEATEAEVYKANRPVFLLLRSRPNIFEGLLLKYCIAQFRWPQRPLRPVLLRNVNQTEDSKKISPFFQVFLHLPVLIHFELWQIQALNKILANFQSVLYSSLDSKQFIKDFNFYSALPIITIC